MPHYAAACRENSDRHRRESAICRLFRHAPFQFDQNHSGSRLVSLHRSVAYCQRGNAEPVGRSAIEADSRRANVKPRWGMFRIESGSQGARRCRDPGLWSVTASR